MINNLKKQFDNVNAKYQEVLKIITTVHKIQSSEERCKTLLKAVYLWHEVKKDAIFIEDVYAKNKGPKARGAFKTLDELYDLHQQGKIEGSNAS